jgi:hypothetical protein
VTWGILCVVRPSRLPQSAHWMASTTVAVPPRRQTMTSLGWLGWPIAALCLILSSTTAAAESTTSLQTSTPSCPTPRSPYGISFACAQAASTEAISRAAAGAANDDPPAAASAAPSCPTPRSPYGISFACAQAASAEAISRVAAGAVSDDPPAAESATPGCPTPRSQWEWYACAHRASDTEIGPP